jgi:hypothetical protein
MHAHVSFARNAPLASRLLGQTRAPFVQAELQALYGEDLHKNVGRTLGR